MNRTAGRSTKTIAWAAVVLIACVARAQSTKAAPETPSKVWVADHGPWIDFDFVM
jgi:hypothetical protein